MSAPNTLTSILVDRVKLDPSGCWIWTGLKNRLGYGRVQYDGKIRRAPRLIYQLMVGPIAPGLQIDHLCRRPACVNPAHLEPVTARENTMRSTAFTATNAKKTHCIRGHANWKVEVHRSGPLQGQSYRKCHTCSKEWLRARRRRMKEASGGK
jgi:HNH endonuclease